MTTTLYVAMIADRHTDPEPYLFETSDEAIGYARTYAQQHAGRPEDFDESPSGGWLYHATFSVEYDSVWVLAKTVGHP